MGGKRQPLFQDSSQYSWAGLFIQSLSRGESPWVAGVLKRDWIDLCLCCLCRMLIPHFRVSAVLCSVQGGILVSLGAWFGSWVGWWPCLSLRWWRVATAGTTSGGREHFPGQPTGSTGLCLASCWCLEALQILQFSEITPLLFRGAGKFTKLFIILDCFPMPHDSGGFWTSHGLV